MIMNCVIVSHSKYESAINGHQQCDNDEKEDFSVMKEMTVTTITNGDVTTTKSMTKAICAFFENDANHQ